MMTSRTIGNQEKKVKQSTAPIRKPQAAVLFLALATSRPRAGGAGAESRASRGARLVATSAMSISSQGRGLGAAGGGRRSEPGARRVAEVAARPAHRAGFPDRN